MITEEQNSRRTVLITGGSGLIGTHLIRKLQNKGYLIAVLSRNPGKVTNATAYYWNIERGEIDKNCLVGVDTIIHLAGANIGTQRWTAKRKKEIIESRTNSIKLLYKAIEETKSPVQTVVSSSAVGYYGDRGAEELTEQSGNGVGFLAECCRLWEESVMEGERYNMRVVRLRIGLLLSKQDGALSKLSKAVRCFLAFPLGSGKQWASWIHLDDLTDMFVACIENTRCHGAYNACAPTPVSNKKMIKEIASKLHRPSWNLPIPVFVLKALLGEMSETILMSTRISSDKIIESGFHFKFPQLDAALSDIFKK